MREREVRQLVALSRKPRPLSVRQHRIEDHESLDRTWQRHRLSVTIMRFANRLIEPFVVYVKDAPSRAPASMW